MKGKRIAFYGLMTALALVLSYVESLVPAFFAVPGMKLGLTNIVVLVTLYTMDYRGALLINLVRILISALLFGNGMSFIYSIAGGILSGLVMILLKKTGRFHIIAVSIAGGVFHNIGQILAAMVLLQTPSLLYYLVILWFSGIASGSVIGLLGGEITKRITGKRL